MNLNPDRDNDHPHSASLVLLFDRIRRGRTVRQVERLIRLRCVVYSISIVAWVVIGMIWTFCSAFIVVLYPLWESRVALTQISTGIVKVHGSPYPSAAVIAPLNSFLFRDV